MKWLAIVLQILLGLLFLMSAVMKLTGGAEDIRQHLGIAPWFWTVTAVVELIGAAGLLAGLAYPRLAVLAGLWLGATMAGGIIAHLAVSDPASALISPAVLLVLALSITALRWLAARLGELLARRAEAMRPRPTAH